MTKDDGGIKHINNLMHTFIEGIAAGIYDDLDDIQMDAREYLVLEEAVKKMSSWTAESSIEDLANIFEGLHKSIEKRKAKNSEDLELAECLKMPSMEE